jgi:hypothetical protein
MSRFSLKRRTFLAGSGALLALPTLEAMLNSNGTAYADGSDIPCRYATFFWGDGVDETTWTPSGAGAGWVPSAQLSPLAPVKEYVSVLSGFDVPIGAHQPHHDGVCSMLTAHPIFELEAGSGDGDHSTTPMAESIDQVIARSIRGSTTHASIQIAISPSLLGLAPDAPDEGVTMQAISFGLPPRPGSPLGFDHTFTPLFGIRRPSVIWSTLFGGGVTPVDPTDPRAGLSASVLDLVRDDAVRLSRRVGSADRARLDAHMTSLSELRNRIVGMMPPPGSCASPAEVTAAMDLSGPENYAAVSRVMSDLLVAAWSCDLTRVASYLFLGSQDRTTFSHLGYGANHHDISHWGDAPARRAAMGEFATFTMENLAYLLERLRATDDGTGAGNLLDHSLIYATSDCRQGLDHTMIDMPILIAGRAGGRLVHPGIHLAAGRSNNTSDVFLTILQAMGTGATQAGGDGTYVSGDRHDVDPLTSTTPVSELLTA